MPPRRQDDIMDIDSGDSDASLDYDVPRRKGKGKAPKQKDKGKGKLTEVRMIPGRLKVVVDSSSRAHERYVGPLRMGGILRQVLGYSPRR